MSTHRFESFARAAMVGLLAVTQSACSDTADQNTDGTGGADGDHIPGTGGDGVGSSGGDSMGGASATGGASNEAGGSAGDGGAGGGAVGVLSSKIIADLSLTEFREMCDQAGGVVETHSHCGGLVTGPGFSYDSDTDVFTEHTCRGYNTCTGFSCVIED